MKAETNHARVLDVGQCSPDHHAIRSMITDRFDAEVDRVSFVDEALDAMRQTRYDLVLVNRVVFDDGSDGSALIQQSKADARLEKVPIMLISNHADAQTDAVAAGAELGFGKAELYDESTRQRLAQFLFERE